MNLNGVLIGLVLTIVPAVYPNKLSNQVTYATTDNDSSKLEPSLTRLKNYLMTYGIILNSIMWLFVLAYIGATINYRRYY